MNFDQFRILLDNNPALRYIIKEAVKPQLWTLNEKNYP
jgi:hypothetical protein